jgi:hypothetical protein
MFGIAYDSIRCPRSRGGRALDADADAKDITDSHRFSVARPHPKAEGWVGISALPDVRPWCHT